MRTDEFIVARTHKDFLNKLLGLNLCGYYQSSKKLDDGNLLWMIRLDGKISKAGWRNYLSTPNEIVEEQSYNEFIFKRHNTYVGSGEKFEYRVVFDIVEYGDSRRYVFRGVFCLDEERCTLNKNVWRKISDKYFFKQL